LVPKNNIQIANNIFLFSELGRPWYRYWIWASWRLNLGNSKSMWV